jgi:hypothetical protein
MELVMRADSPKQWPRLRVLRTSTPAIPSALIDTLNSPLSHT